MVQSQLITRLRNFKVEFSQESKSHENGRDNFEETVYKFSF